MVKMLEDVVRSAALQPSLLLHWQYSINILYVPVRIKQNRSSPTIPGSPINAQLRKYRHSPFTVRQNKMQNTIKNQFIWTEERNNSSIHDASMESLKRVYGQFLIGSLWNTWHECLETHPIGNESFTLPNSPAGEAWNVFTFLPNLPAHRWFYMGQMFQ